MVGDAVVGAGRDEGCVVGFNDVFLAVDEHQAFALYDDHRFLGVVVVGRGRGPHREFSHSTGYFRCSSLSVNQAS